MTFQGVPWFVGGGAENPPEAARLLAHVATRGAAGVLLPDDCEVAAMAVPSGNVRVLPGSIVVSNTKSNADGEVYLGRNPDDHTVPIAPTGVGVTRSDLVFIRVADPQYADEPAPTSVVDGPYVWPEVAAGVDPGTTTVAEAITQGVLPAGTVGIALARVDMPASTGTVTAAEIVDVRQLPAARSQRRQSTVMPTAGDTLTSAAYVTWPPEASWSFDVPEWATHAVVHIVGASLKYGATNVNGDLRVKLGTETGQSVAYDVEAVSGKERGDFHALDTLAVPTGLRGTTQTLTMQGKRDSATGGLQSSTTTALIADIEFQERIR